MVIWGISLLDKRSLISLILIDDDIEDDDDDDDDEEDLEDKPTSYAGLSLLGLRNFFSRFFQ